MSDTATETAVNPNGGSRGSIIAAIVIVLLVAATAVIGGSFGTDLWYERLVKPDLNPPSWVFGPVSTTLYLLIAYAAWRIWQKETYAATKRKATLLFLLQLVLNACWSWLFFGRHEIGLALIDILLLVVAIALMILTYARIDRPAALLMTPYLLWVGFATYLTWALWSLN